MKPNGSNWRNGRGRLDLTAEQAALRLGIRPNPLRNIESNQPRAAVSLALALRASRLYVTPIRDLVVGWHRPAVTASRDEWVAYAVGEGIDFATASRWTKAQLIDLPDASQSGDDAPEPEPEQPGPKPERQRDPSSPPPRKNGKDDRHGPRRSAEMRVAS